jgi:hypothetical protein
MLFNAQGRLRSRAFPPELIDHIEDMHLSAIFKPLLGNIIAPDVVHAQSENDYTDIDVPNWRKFSHEVPEYNQSVTSRSNTFRLLIRKVVGVCAALIFLFHYKTIEIVPHVAYQLTAGSSGRDGDISIL